MDKSADEIVFIGERCNFCVQASKSLESIRPLKEKLTDLIEDIKASGVGKKYDCLIGLSGGVDSSYLLYLAHSLGLRPLTFSVDNGWNTKESDENVMRLVEGLKVPFIRYSLDRAKFRELQSAFIKAGQKNIEIPTDHVLFAVTYEMASKYGIKYILSGGNVATESIMPASWGYNARDLVHIQDVYQKMKGQRISGLPTLSLFNWNYYRWVKGTKIEYLLDYVSYNRRDAIKILEEKFGYKPYGEKHCESVFTWWFQSYYLFEKFGIDKRKAHLSSEIVSGQITRAEALNELQKNPVYPSIGLESKIHEYPKRDYTEFKTDEKLYSRIAHFIKWITWKS